MIDKNGIIKSSQKIMQWKSLFFFFKFWIHFFITMWRRRSKPNTNFMLANVVLFEFIHTQTLKLRFLYIPFLLMKTIVFILEWNILNCGCTPHFKRNVTYSNDHICPFQLFQSLKSFPIIKKLFYLEIGKWFIRTVLMSLEVWSAVAFF